MAAPHAWAGTSDIPLELTPVCIAVSNQSGRDIVLRRSDVELLGQGRSLQALAPDAIEPQTHRLSLGNEPASPFLPTPPPSPPNLSATNEPTDTPPRPSSPAFSFREPLLPYAVDPDTRACNELRERALPEGRIPNGEERSGFVYFDRLPEVARLDLKLTVRPAAGGSPIATIRIPFRVSR